MAADHEEYFPDGMSQGEDIGQSLAGPSHDYFGSEKSSRQNLSPGRELDTIFEGEVIPIESLEFEPHPEKNGFIGKIKKGAEGAAGGVVDHKDQIAIGFVSAVTVIGIAKAIHARSRKKK